jgi:PIN domain nuclease of toxin-antitoxin system
VSSSAEYVLDSTAVLALLYSEPGHQYVKEVLGKSAVSAVNLAEIVNKLAQMGPMPEAVRESLVGLELRVEDWSEDMAYRSSEFSPLSKSHGLSLGDRACLTLAKQLRATAVTSDRAWRRIPSLGVRIMIFR